MACVHALCAGAWHACVRVSPRPRHTDQQRRRMHLCARGHSVPSVCVCAGMVAWGSSHVAAAPAPHTYLVCVQHRTHRSLLVCVPQRRHVHVEVRAVQSRRLSSSTLRSPRCGRVERHRQRRHELRRERWARVGTRCHRLLLRKAGTRASPSRAFFFIQRICQTHAKLRAARPWSLPYLPLVGDISGRTSARRACVGRAAVCAAGRGVETRE